jgi:hypothetical protein
MVTNKLRTEAQPNKARFSKEHTSQENLEQRSEEKGICPSYLSSPHIHMHRLFDTTETDELVQHVAA